MELADAIVVHKADGDNVRLAKKTVSEYKQILHFLQPATPGWMSTAMPVSSWEKRGLDKVWDTIGEFRQTVEANNYWSIRVKIKPRIGSNQ